MRILLAVLIGVFAFSGAARADYFVWQDPKSGISLSYPDTWAMVSQRQPDEVFAIIAPSNGDDDAVCRVKVRDDRRFMIYPPHLGREVQTISYNREFWDEYLGEYDNVEVYGTHEQAGLGKGFGSFVVAGYDAALFSDYGKRRGIASASLYFDKAYIVDCSSRAEVFHQWQPLFLSIMGSVDFKKTHDELWSGDYRNFFSDPRMEFQWPGTAAVNRY
jgi:hypothetical protein